MRPIEWWMDALFLISMLLLVIMIVWDSVGRRDG